ncbi:MAG: NAD(P)-dependent oxidoreductase [Burkholderiales bacterium]|nr:NAD(P)-dependent oxidoreductase [Burkholderiales bacterium]
MTPTLGKIGFVGIGAMGTPMAVNLIKAGYKLVIYDADPGHATAFASTPEVEVAENLAELGRSSDVVITMLPDGKIVRRVMCGDNDDFHNCVAAGLKPGTIVIDMSSSSPLGTRELGALLESRGVKLIDAPVSGGVKRAVSAELAIMVGSDQAVFDRYRPLLEKMGNQIFHAGPLGAGHAIKALNNYVSAAGLVAACEAVIAGKRFGLDPGVIVDILNVSSGMNNTTKVKMKQFMLSGAFNAGFTTGLMAKDVRTALEIAQAMEAPTLLAQPCAEIWDNAARNLGSTADHTAMFRYLEGVSKNNK